MDRREWRRHDECGLFSGPHHPEGRAVGLPPSWPTAGVLHATAPIVHRHRITYSASSASSAGRPASKRASPLGRGKAIGAGARAEGRTRIANADATPGTPFGWVVSLW